MLLSWKEVLTAGDWPYRWNIVPVVLMLRFISGLLNLGCPNWMELAKVGVFLTGELPTVLTAPAPWTTCVISWLELA